MLTECIPFTMNPLGLENKTSAAPFAVCLNVRRVTIFAAQLLLFRVNFFSGHGY